MSTMSRNSVKKALFGAAALLGLAAATTNAATLIFTGETETGVNQPLTDSYFYTGCYSPVNIRINPDGVETTSTDVKFFLTGRFDFQSDLTNYSGLHLGDAFQTYYNFGNDSASPYLTGGQADSGTYQGQDYWYINAYSDATAPLSGTDVNGYDFATVYLKPVVTFNTGILNFYYLGANINYDDSNVSSGTNADSGTGYTQYVDALSAVAGEGSYAFNNSYDCPFKPYILDATYASILGNNIPEAYDAGVNYTYITSAGTDTEPSTIEDPVSGPYSNTIVHEAGPDLSGTDYNGGAWDIWTNQPIVVTLTGGPGYDQEFKVNLTTGFMTNSNVALDTQSGAEDTWSTVKVLTISGQYEGGIEFSNRIGNQGEKYASGDNNYYDFVEINTFFYDTHSTEVLTATIATGDGYEIVAFSGIASTDASPDSQASWTTDDDKFRIIKFSGTNTTLYGQPTTTSYNAELNALYVQTGGTAQDFSMTKTGIVTTDPENPVATDTSAVMFTESWEGYVYYSDIAGNTGAVWVDVNIEPKVTFTILGTPAFRDTTANGNLTLTGEIWLAYQSGSTWNFTHDSKNVLGDTQVVLNSEGTGAVSMVVPASGQNFLVVYKGTGMLSVGFTGVWTNDISDTATNYFDFRSGANNIGTNLSDIYPKVTYSDTDYIIA